PVVAPGKPWRGRSFFGCAASSLFGEIVARRCETSFLEDRMTVTPPGSFATAGSGIVSVSASASATTVVALSIPLLPHRDAGWLRGRERYGAMAGLSSSDSPIARQRAGTPHPDTGGWQRERDRGGRAQPRSRGARRREARRSGCRVLHDAFERPEEPIRVLQPRRDRAASKSLRRGRVLLPYCARDGPEDGQRALQPRDRPDERRRDE